MKKILLLILAVSLAMFTISSRKKFKTGKKVEITKMDYFVENIDPSYFDSFSDATLFYNFFVYYDDSRYNINKIKSFDIEDQTGTSWTINLSSYLDQESKYIGGFGRWYDDTLSNNGSLLSIGKMVCRVSYRNKQITEDSYIISLPGSKERIEDAFIYSEDYNGVKRDNYYPCLKRAKVKDAVFTGDRYIIDFTIDDNNAFNGRVWFFNRNGDYVGKTDDFIHPFSLESARFLNKGDSFYTDDTVNRIEIPGDKISFKNQYTSDDIDYIHIVIEDGWQFQDDTEKGNFHYRSISKLYTVEFIDPSST